MKVIDLTSADYVHVRAPSIPDFLSIRTQELVNLDGNQVGVIVGKKSLSLKGVLCQPGIVHPGFKGYLEPFFVVYGNWVAQPGEKIAHLIILR